MRTIIRNSYTPKAKDFCNTIVIDNDSGRRYLFDSDGAWSQISGTSVQSDWDETDENSPAFIKNKPEIGDVSHLVEMIEAEATTRAEQDEFLHNENVALGNELNAETNARTQKDTQLENAINSKANQSALDEEISNRTSEDATLSARIDALSGLEYEVVQQLPATGRKGVIYLVPQDRQAPDIYDEYLWVNTAFERIGSTAVDLTDYVKNTDYATSNKAGVVKVSGTYGAYMSNGTIVSSTKTFSQYNSSDDTLFIGKGTLENVIEGKGLVSSTDYADATTGGVIKVNSAYGIKVSSGNLASMSRSYDQYVTADNSMFIGKATLENVISGKGLATITIREW